MPRLSFHPTSLVVNLIARLSQQYSLPYHRADLQESNDYQAECEPYEFPLYGYVLAAILASLIASWGGWLWGGGHRIWGGLLSALGLVLIAATMSAIGFADPSFWRVGWRILCGQNPDRRDCQDKENRQPFQHNSVIVQQKGLTQSLFLFHSKCIEGDMANVLSIDKKIAVIAALAEGSSIRSTPLTAVRSFIMQEIQNAQSAQA